MNMQIPVSADETQQPQLTAHDLRSEVDPIWCPGCGHHGVLTGVTKAMAQLGLPREKFAFISGIGCSSRIPAYTSVYGFHGVHGRALAIAAGVKLARPDLTVLAASGDGDGLSIGGNHFLHACRRNVDMTYIIMDNRVYGMTKGQASPTTLPDWTKSKLTPEGTGIEPIDPVKLALAAGANFIGRAFAGNANDVAHLILEGIRHPGFSVIHVLSPCVTYCTEQREWRKMVHAQPEDAAATTFEAAVAELGKQDGFTTGILYRGDRAPFETAAEATSTIADISRRMLLP